jgi:cyclophilin family peptidyl-prolyl cis-trans isomerase
MNFEEKKDAVEELKAKGNKHFKEKMFKEACENYKEGITYLDSIVEARYQSAISDLWKALQLNLCVCLNSMNAWKESKMCADKVLQRDLDNPKAYYLRGIAEKNLLLFDEALDDLTKALHTNPSDERIKYEIEKVKEELKKIGAKEKKSMVKLFKEQTLYSEKDPVVVKVPEYDESNPKVYMDIRVGTRDTIKIVIELFKGLAPKTAENFRCLCTGEKSTGVNKLYYGGFRFYKLIKGYILEGGDIENNNGTGGKSIYLGKFTPEITHIEHSEVGLLSTVDNEPKGSDSKFFILLSSAQGLDTTHTVFGRIIKGLDLLMEVNNIEVDEKNKPKESIIIESCGMYEV